MKRVLSFVLCLLFVLALFPQGSVNAYAVGKEVWVKDYYKDVFGDPTEDFYFTNKDLFTGTYNSADADDAPLGVSILVDDIGVSFILYENGNTKLKNRSEQAVSYSIAVKAADGSKFSAEGVMSSGSDCIEVYDIYTDSIINALTAEEGKVAFYFENEDQNLTNYLFTADCDNLKELFQEEQYQAALLLLEEKDKASQYDGLTILLELGDYKDSASYIEQLGSSTMLLAIGNNYYNGRNVEQDYEKALEWYEKAAELGNSTAMYAIGFAYEEGGGVEKDYAKAMEWFLKAAELGNDYAMDSIGLAYEKGRGVEQDYEKALEWYGKAAELGNETAKENYDKLKSKMN